MGNGSAIVSHDHRYLLETLWRHNGQLRQRSIVGQRDIRPQTGSFLNRFNQSVELEGGTIETVAAMNDHSSDWPLFNHPCRQCAHCNMYGTTDFWALRRTSV